MATLASLGLLDTPPDPRFDRITRLATQMSETGRDSSICAHAVADRATLVVNDALVDARFAENPLVVSAPRPLLRGRTPDSARWNVYRIALHSRHALGD